MLLWPINRKHAIYASWVGIRYFFYAVHPYIYIYIHKFTDISWNWCIPGSKRVFHVSMAIRLVAVVGAASAATAVLLTLLFGERLTKRWEHEAMECDQCPAFMSLMQRDSHSACTHRPNKKWFKLFNKCLQNYSIDHWPIFSVKYFQLPSKLLIIFNGHSHANTFTMHKNNSQNESRSHLQHSPNTNTHTHTQTVSSQKYE